MKEEKTKDTGKSEKEAAAGVQNYREKVREKVREKKRDRGKDKFLR